MSMSSLNMLKDFIAKWSFQELSKFQKFPSMEGSDFMKFLP